MGNINDISASRRTSTHYRDVYDGSHANKRANAYALLSSLFRDDPNAGIVTRFIELWETVGTGHEAHELGTRSNEAAHRFRETWGEDDFRISLERRREFARLFLTRGSIHPYESVYLGTRKRLMDDPWVDVCEFYREAGMQKGPDELHPEDHVSVELGFIAHLAFLTGPTPAEMERRFLDEHLVRWVPRLCRDIEARPDASYYRIVARFTRALLEEDHVRFPMPAGQRDSTR